MHSVSLFDLYEKYKIKFVLDIDLRFTVMVS